MLNLIFKIILYFFLTLIAIRVLMEIWLFLFATAYIIKFYLSKDFNKKLDCILWIGETYSRAFIPKKYIQEYAKRNPEIIWAQKYIKKKTLNRSFFNPYYLHS